MILHHPSESTLVAYAAGTLPEALAAVAATHLGQCSVCQRDMAALEAAGGALLEELAPVPMAGDALSRILARANEPADAPQPVLNAELPPPLDRVRLGGWWTIGLGTRYRPLRVAGAAWGGLILVQPGRALPRHGHVGLELTCVLAGSFTDDAGEYRPGDVCEPNVDHDQPQLVIGTEPCLCVIASEGMRLRGLLGLAQRLLFP